MTVPMALLDLPFDGDLNGSNAVTGSVTADTTGTVTFDAPNHDSSGGYAAVGDPGSPGGLTNLYPDPGFDNFETAWLIDVEGGHVQILNDFGNPWVRVRCTTDGDGGYFTSDVGLAIPGTTAINVSFLGQFFQQDAAEVFTIFGRVLYDDASFDDTPIDVVSTIEGDYVPRGADMTVDSGKTVDSVQMYVMCSGTVSVGAYYVDDLVIGIDSGAGTDPDPGTLSLPTVGNITDNAGAIAFWVQADADGYWNDPGVTDLYPLLTITTASGEADRFAFEMNRDEHTAYTSFNGTTFGSVLPFGDTDTNWHLFILSYDAGTYIMYTYLPYESLCGYVTVGEPLPTDGDIYLLSSPYHDRFGGHVSNVQTFSDALTPPQRQYLFDGTPPPPAERIGGLLRTGPPPLNIGLTRTRYGDEPITLAREEPPEPIALNRDGPPVAIGILTTTGAL